MIQRPYMFLSYTKKSSKGFSLIELAIVLVVIGLIIGGILAGRELLYASAIRAQISQIEKYQQAATTFKAKYGYLPGDIPNPDATNFGFLSRGAYAGEGDGNGVLEGVMSDSASANAGNNPWGEPMMFWVDLSTAQLLNDKFSTAQPNLVGTFNWSNITSYFPKTPLNDTGSVVIYSGGGNNFFQITSITPFMSNAYLNARPALAVREAYSIDNKTDDGMPETGRVTVWYMGVSGGSGGWMNTGYACGTLSWTYLGFQQPLTNSTGASMCTCFDNHSTAGAAVTYSLSQNNGAGTNCQLSIKFQ